jgi:YkoY family integral membrane protein
MFTPNDWVLIFTVALLDGLLSVDNALVNAAQAQHLPPKKRQIAIIFGLAAAAVLRIAALGLAAYIIQYPIIKLLGAGWLFWLTAKFFFLNKEEGEGKPKHHHTGVLWRVMLSIAITDLVFSIDNIVAAVGMTTNFEIIVIGVLASILVMMFATQLMAMLMRRYPRLESAAYVIIGFIGLTILAADIYHVIPNAPHIELSGISKFAVTMSIVILTILWEEICRAKDRKVTRNHPIEGNG